MSVVRYVGAVKISGQTVIAKVSGEIVIAKVSGEVVKISGQVVDVNIASSAIMMPVDIQGATIDVPVTGVVAVMSGTGPIIAEISGETVIAKVSGETVVGKISGETVIAKISGETVELASGTGPIIIETPSGLLAGYTQIPSLSGGVAIGSGAVLSVVVKNLSGNASMWIGPVGVNSGAGFIILAGEAISLDIDNLNKVYAYAEVSGQYISWLGVAR